MIAGNAETARDEESAPRGRVQVNRRRDISERLGQSRVATGPAVDRPADEQVLAGRAAQFHEPRDSPNTGAVDAVVARDVGGAVAQPEADPETVAALRILRPRHSRRAGQNGEQGDDSRGRMHGPSLAGYGSEFRRLPCPTRRACGRGGSVPATGQPSVPRVRALRRRFDPAATLASPPIGLTRWDRVNPSLCTTCRLATAAYSMLCVVNCYLILI